MDKKLLILAAVVIVVIFALTYKGKDISNPMAQKTDILTQEEAKTKVSDYVNNNLMQPGSTAEIKEVVAEGELYKVIVKAGEQEITAYMTKDGAKFFPNVMDMNEKVKTAESPEAPAPEIPKSEKPNVELFVMSYCPYGTQIEKGILPVIGALGDKIDYKLRFVDYAMHDKKEIDENLRQYCIQKNEPDKLNAYLGCFLKSGEGTEAACLQESGVLNESIVSCMDASDKEFKITENYGDKNTWNGQFPTFDVDKALNEKYGVQGSPTLVINGAVAKSSRDSRSLLKTICAGFETAPEGCGAELTSDMPSPGFGEGVGAAGSDANCGS